MAKYFLIVFLFLFQSVNGQYKRLWERPFHGSSLGFYLGDNSVDNVGHLYETGTNLSGEGPVIRRINDQGITDWSLIFPFDSVNGSSYGSGNQIWYVDSNNIYISAKGYLKNALIKINSQGVLLWIRLFNSSVPGKIVISDDHYIYLTYVDDISDELIVQKLDSTNQSIWFTSCSPDIFTGSPINPILTLNHKFCILFSCIGSPNEPHFLSLDSLGGIIFDQVLSHQLLNLSCSQSGEIYGSGVDSKIDKLDILGNVQNSFDLPSSRTIFQFRFDQFGKIYALTYNSVLDSFYIGRYDTSGLVLWEKNLYPTNYGHLSVQSFLQDSNDNTILFASESDSSYFNNERYLSVISYSSSGLELGKSSYLYTSSNQLGTIKAHLDHQDNALISLQVAPIGNNFISSSKLCHECYPNISGSVIKDNNRNCNFDLLEPKLRNCLVFLSPDSIYTFTDQTGNFDFISHFDSSTISSPNQVYWNFNCPLNGELVVLDSLNPISSNNLIYKDDQDSLLQDLWIHISTAPFTRSGDTTLLYVTCGNHGTKPSPSIVKFILDPNMIYLGSSFPTSAISSDTLFYTLDTLMMGQSFTITIKFTTFPTLPPATNIPCLSIIESVPIDFFPPDNYDSTNIIVTNSFDPNEKTVRPSGQGVDGLIHKSDSCLNYTVFFQNTGNDLAYNILVVDTLDENLDISTFEMIASSHPFRLTLDNRTLTWEFSDINLPDTSVSKTLSQGFLSFKINLKQNLHDGTGVSNYAQIYFDFNSPLVTNTVRNTISDSLINVGENNITNFSIYPNPTKGMIQVNLPMHEISELIVTDFIGRTVVDLLLPKDPFIDLKCESGVYFLSVITKTGKKMVGKFVISGN